MVRYEKNIYFEYLWILWKTLEINEISREIQAVYTYKIIPISVANCPRALTLISK